MKSAQQILWYASILAEFILLARLLAYGLWRRYRFFTLYLSIAIARSILLLNLDLFSSTYFQYWRWSEPVIFAAQALTVFEAYRLSMANYRTERNELRYVLLFVLGLAVAASVAAAVFIDGRQAGPWQQSYYATFLYRRLALGVLAISAGVTAGHCWWFRAQEPWNLKAHRLILLLYLLQMTLAQLFANRLPEAFIIRANILALALAPLCFVAWAVALRPAGEACDRRYFSIAERNRIEDESAEFEGFMRSRRWRPER